MKTVFVVISMLGYSIAASGNGQLVSPIGLFISGLIGYVTWYLMNKFFPPDDMDFPNV